MFDSQITAKDLIDSLKSEVDIASPIPDSEYLSWLNSLQFLLYGEIIKELGKIEVENENATLDGSPVDIESYDIEGQSKIRFEDIYTVYADILVHEGEPTEKLEKVQFIKSTMANGVIFPFTYYKNGVNLAYNSPLIPKKLIVIYFVKPQMLTESNYETLTVAIPTEFIDIVKAKLRGEAYKYANEGSLAAMWLNDYNVLLENFKVWVDNRRPTLGM